MSAFPERLLERAATIDERLSEVFAPLSGRKDDADLAARRLAAWCKAAANGDWGPFARRLKRDHLSLSEVLARFATSSFRGPSPRWIDDAGWIVAALASESPAPQNVQMATKSCATESCASEPCAFEPLLRPLIDQAESLLWAGLPEPATFARSARASLRQMLVQSLSDLSAAALYEVFAKMRDRDANTGHVTDKFSFERFCLEMRSGEFHRLFEERPVLLRLIATLTRQWIEVSREFVDRLRLDLPILCEAFDLGADAVVTQIEGSRSDRHNEGRSVLIVTFGNGAKVIYKPKDLRLDVAWHHLIERLNAATPPIDLRAVRAVARNGYGWTEFVEHTGCEDAPAVERYFRRAGALLALFHCFVATDMHQENIIAAGDHPVPIDLETLLQSPPLADATLDAESAAHEAAGELLSGSVMRVGLLPAYGRAPDNSVFAMGGLTSGWNSRVEIAWADIHTERMRPTRRNVVGSTNPNLPHRNGAYAAFADHFEAFVDGFQDYAHFLSRKMQSPDLGGVFDGFEGVPIRKVVRPTRFYSMLLQRLKNHRLMDDGAIWSAEADFIARLSNWNSLSDVTWPLNRAERAALLTLNVPHFTLPSDGAEICDSAGVRMQSGLPGGLAQARERARRFDADEIAWQVEVIRANAEPARPPATARIPAESASLPLTATQELFASEIDRIAAELATRAIRRDASAAWIGLDWLGDAEVYQLTRLGPDLYNGAAGIALFLAAHAQATEAPQSAELARAGIANLRSKLNDRNAARFARSLGIGGAAGLGSVIYALSVISKCLRDDDLLVDALTASRLMTDDVIASDRRLDVIGGSAGAIVGLLRLHRDTGSDDVLKRAVQCAEHLLRQERVGEPGSRSWAVQGLSKQALNGMSHGAAGFAYALGSLAVVTGREDFAAAAAECLAFENASYDADRKNWPDRRSEGEPGWPCQWCHGAPGIGMARAALLRQGALDAALLKTDLGNALAGTERGWRGKVDTLCCGAMGSVEFFCEAADALEREDVSEAATRRLAAVVDAARIAGGYRWNGGQSRFNLGLFRGLAGVGYTLLRRLDERLPNVLIWE